MKAISLWQPWASLIGRGKSHETRHWSTRYRGEIAIHAAKRWTARERDFCLNDPTCRVLEKHRLLEFTRTEFKFFLPFGAIVAVVFLADCIPTGQCITFPNMVMEGWEHYVDPLDYQFGNYESGRYAWEFRDIRILPEPIPYRGAQGFFDIPDELLKGIRKAVER